MATPAEDCAEETAQENASKRTGLFTSGVVATCELCGVNPFHYLTELDRHAQEVAARPQDWMPWNYLPP